MKPEMASLADNRQFRGVLGINKEEFILIEKEMSRIDCLLKAEEVKRGKQTRKPGSGMKGTLSSHENKLFFCLFYLKNYMTFDVLGSIFGFQNGNAWTQLNNHLPLVKTALKSLNVLPETDSNRIAMVIQAIENDAKISCDAYEIPCDRPAEKEKQELMYSGKKKDIRIKD